MKMHSVASSLLTSDNMQSSIMGMDAKGMEIATWHLRDKIYSDKIKAVVREYACNAIDEHKKHGIDRPVEIGIRQEPQDSIFFVRDYANGLSEDGIRNVFGMYFRSTKSDSNECIGGFGIGSKSGHSYQDTFFVVSHFNGLKSSYACVLGGGDSGVPVGHIYKIDESPTSESGIEISLVIKKSDFRSFQENIKEFVTFSTEKIQYSLNGIVEMTNPKSVWQKQFSEFSFRLIKSKEFSNDTSIYLQMGGVKYGHVRAENNLYAAIINDHCLVVDIPIGKMSLPISREGFEETASNKQVIEQIKKYVSDLIHEDTDKFKNLSFFELMDSNDECLYGEVFRVTRRHLFGKLWKFAKSIHLANPSLTKVTEFEDNKPVIISIPDNSASEYWKQKVKAYAIDNNKQFYYTSSESIHSETVEALFSCKHARKLPYPKIKVNEKKFAVYSKFSYNERKFGTFSAAEFIENAIKAKSNYDDNLSVEENLQNAIQKISSQADLEHLTIRKRTTSHYHCWTCNSSDFIDKVKNLGFIVYRSAEWNSINEKLLKQEDLNNKKFKIKSYAENIASKLNPKMKRFLAKEKNCNRIHCLFSNLMQEKSLRTKVIGKFLDSYSNNLNERSELRSIMRLK